jgi:hypothetical protein
MIFGYLSIFRHLMGINLNSPASTVPPWRIDPPELGRTVRTVLNGNDHLKLFKLLCHAYRLVHENLFKEKARLPQEIFVKKAYGVQ